jgi:hypothetical protein
VLGLHRGSPCRPQGAGGVYRHPEKQDLYILQNEAEWTSLYTFISIYYCRHCQARETYFIDGWAGAGTNADLLSFERGHREASQEIGQELTRWLSN